MVWDLRNSFISNEMKILSCCLIVILISSMSTVGADDIVINSDNQKQSKFDDGIVSIKDDTRHGNYLHVTLTENMGLAENSSPQNDQIKQPVTTHAYSINLSEKITIDENRGIPLSVIILPHSLDLQTTMNKISNNERSRFNGKLITIDDIQSDEQTTITLSHLENNFAQHTENNVVPSLEKIFYTNIISNISLEYNGITIVSQITQPIENEVVWLSHATTDPKNPTMLLLLVPLSGYLLLRSREEKFRFFKSKQGLLFCF